MFGDEDELKVAPKGVEKTHKCVLVCLLRVTESADVVRTRIGISTCSSVVLLPWCISKSSLGLHYEHRSSDSSVCRFTDKQALSPDFKEELCKVAKVVQPFVHW